MKNVMLLSGGTSTAWHIASVLKKYYSNECRIIICDINPPYLVHTIVCADKYIQVPLIKSPEYYCTMLHHMQKEHIDILIPLIDDDILLFSKDNADLRAFGVKSVAPCISSIKSLSDKEKLSHTLNSMGIDSPRIMKNSDEIDDAQFYFTKNAIGFGSRGAERVVGRKAKEYLREEGRIVQEVCYKPEVTVDVVNHQNKIYTMCRERIETKLGVSTKCRVYHDAEIQSIMMRIAQRIELPSVFCVQFMKNLMGNWTLIDFNLRSGGGTAISAAVGFEALRFACAVWLELPADAGWLQFPEKEKYVVRTYKEIVTQ